MKINGIYRQMLRKLRGVHYPFIISNHAISQKIPNYRNLTIDIVEARWKLFGKILKLPFLKAPAKMMMGCFFTDIVIQTRRGAKPTFLSVLLNADLERSGQGTLSSITDLEKLRMTEECGGWKQLCERIINERKAFERYTEFQAHEKKKERKSKRRITDGKKRRRVTVNKKNKCRTNESFEEDQILQRKKRKKLNDYVEPVGVREEETSTACCCSDTASLGPAVSIGHSYNLRVRPPPGATPYRGHTR